MQLTAETPVVVDAGPFGDWLAKFRASLRGNSGMEVPCGDCVGCCISSYAVWLRPDDRRALARIPVTLLTTAPGLPAKHQIMPALADGKCPMLKAGRCSIYDDRPQTCIDYDCRIFAAAGIEAGGDDRAAINRRIREWRFRYPTPGDRQAHDAVLSAAAFIREHANSFPGRAPSAPTGIAVLAIKAYGIFLDSNHGSEDRQQTALAIVQASREFDQGTVTNA